MKYFSKCGQEGAEKIENNSHLEFLDFQGWHDVIQVLTKAITSKRYQKTINMQNLQVHVVQRIARPVSIPMMLISMTRKVFPGVWEVVARIWLNKFMSEGDCRRYVLYTDVPTKDRQWSPHHYLNYYPTPDYKHGLTSHNSLGYRDKEIDVSKDHNTFW